MSDKFFTDIARQYVKTTGQDLLVENSTIELTATPTLDFKVKGKKRRRYNTAAFGLVASIIILVGVGLAVWPQLGFDHNLEQVAESAQAPANQATTAPAPDAPAEWSNNNDVFFGLAPEPAPALLPELAAEAEEDMIARGSAIRASLTPPTGWIIAETDHDGDMVIFHLEGEYGNRVVVMAERPSSVLDFSNFIPVLINDTYGFMQIESTHSVLIYQHDGVLFTLTTAYDYSDLIVLAHALSF